MAVLLALIDAADDSATDAAWRVLRRRARERACEDGVDRIGQGWRAWAARTVPGEPDPLVDLGSDGREPAGVLLLDRAVSERDRPSRERLRWSDRRLFDGTPCASVRIGASGRHVELTRDVLGQRPLAWATTGGGVVIASGEHILRAHPEVPGDLDLDWFAALVAGIAPEDDQSAFGSIRLLPAGATATWAGSRWRFERQRLEPESGPRSLPDLDLIARFRELVDDAVARALAGVRRPAILLSGGLDSALIAESMARQWQGRERPLAITYGFDRWKGIDERIHAWRIADRLGLDWRDHAVDDLVPMRPGIERPVCPDTPFATPWREIKEAGYRIAAEAGCDAVLSGNFGDHLYAHPARWLVDALRHGRRDLVVRALLTSRIGDLARDPGLRILARPWRLRHAAAPTGLARLAEPVRARLEARWRARLESMAAWPRPTQALLNFDALAAFDSSGEDWYAARHRLAFRQPLRDPALVRFMLSLPAHHSTRGVAAKWLARAALRGRLPDAEVDRPKGGDLTPFAEAADRSERATLDSLAASAWPLLEAVLAAPRAVATARSGDLTWLAASVGQWLAASDGDPRRAG
jgi:asparagine synthase (glutamine-hydrolysing)